MTERSSAPGARKGDVLRVIAEALVPYLREHLKPADGRAPVFYDQYERGANTWLVVPNDDAVFTGAEIIDGVRCVNPLQAYLDLKAQPERASEASSELRTRLFSKKP